MMKPTPRKAGLASGPRRTSAPLPTPSVACHLAAITLISVSSAKKAPTPMPASRLREPPWPFWPALWISAAATDSGKGSSALPTSTRRVMVTNRMPRIPPAIRMIVDTT